MSNSVKIVAQSHVHQKPSDSMRLDDQAASATRGIHMYVSSKGGNLKMIDLYATPTLYGWKGTVVLQGRHACPFSPRTDSAWVVGHPEQSWMR